MYTTSVSLIWLVVRFGASMSRSMALRPLGDGGLPGVTPSDIVFALNQVRIRAPQLPTRSWQLTQAIVARLGVAHEQEVVT